MTIAPELLRRIVEGALLAAGQPLSEEKLLSLLEEEEQPSNTTLRDILEEIAQDCIGRGFELRKVATGWRFQVPEDLAPWVNRLWEEKAQRYSRATLETLAIIAYRQPVTRGDIEEIRGVAVSSQIVKTLLERGWVKVVGHRDVPGKPSLYATTREFLDYFNLSSLDNLPTLAEIRDIESLNKILEAEGLSPEEIAAAETDSADIEVSQISGEVSAESGESEVQEGSEEEVVDIAAEESVGDIDNEPDDIDGDVRVEALVEEIVAQSEDQPAEEVEPVSPVEREKIDEKLDEGDRDDAVEAAASLVAMEIEREQEETVLENLGAVDTGDTEAAPQDDNRETELVAEAHSTAPIAATLPPSSLFGDNDTASEVGLEDRAEGNADVDDDSQDVVQVENTTP
ncbi:SMC-Scp complex subunit ScpB [Microbulbifer sp. MLAF003]|uniref:SMC-Scp complex subunit ScpB n=1 Tax=unclassified Microbulbifer TaxID=2619833 RepID=UPI0024AE6BA7|nr:SMC-Scp complex subunit ScpB [Microbulbifer sp. MLAF003]WHI52491.1 SMC-Scp complex subunit ScpB [Microbulbifer sp. MLAF003]